MPFVKNIHRYSVGALFFLATCVLVRDASAGPVFTEWYWGPFFFAILVGPWITLAAILLRIGWGIWSRKRNRRLPNLLFIRLWLACIAVAIAAMMAWGFYVENRTGALNPYTDDCIKMGFKGAKGNSCY